MKMYAKHLHWSILIGGGEDGGGGGAENLLCRGSVNLRLS